MTPKDRYNAIIDDIERMAKMPYLSRKEIVNRIQASNPNIASTFYFLTGDTLSDYVNSRLAQAAYRYIIAEERYDDRVLDNAIIISGRDDHSSLIKLFQKYFGVAVKEAHELKDTSKLKPPKYWDTLSQKDLSLESTEEKASATKTIFGIDKSLYERITEINKLKDQHDFDLKYSTVAVGIADIFSWKLDDAFDYVNTIKQGLEYILDDGDFPTALSVELLTEKKLWDISTDPEINYCIACNLSLPSALDAISRLRELGYASVTECHPRLLNAFRETSINPIFFQQACEYYKNHTDPSYTDMDFVYFIDRISMGTPIEIAFEEMQNEKLWNEDDTFDLNPLDLDTKVDEDSLAFKAWAQQECDYRFDPYFDSDDPKGQ